MDHQSEVERAIDERIQKIAEELSLPIEAVRRHVGGESRRQISAVLDESVIAMLVESATQLRQSRSDTIAFGAFLVRLLIDLSDEYTFVVRSRDERDDEIEVTQLWRNQGARSVSQFTAGGLTPTRGFEMAADVSVPALARLRERCDHMFARMQEQAATADKVFRDIGRATDSGEAATTPRP